MSGKTDIAVVIAGHRQSPLATYMIESRVVRARFVTGNVLDFSIHHADPKKLLHYHLEFTNLLECRARKSMDSLAIIEKLGQFFEFYNPLKLSTLSYLISKYITSINASNKGFGDTWREVSAAIFNDEFCLPLFEETRILHVKSGDTEVPVRQHVMASDLDSKRDQDKSTPAKGKKKEGEPAKDAGREVSGIIDLDLVDNMRGNESAARFLETAAGVILVPTDMLSLCVLFSSDEFKEMLRNTEGEIVMVSPAWPGNEISLSEREVLEKSGFPTTIEGITAMVKDHVDAVILHDITGPTLQKIREIGVTVLVENLDPATQRTEEFLQHALKCVGLELDDFRAEQMHEKTAIGEKLANILGMRLAPKDGEIAIVEAAPVQGHASQPASEATQATPGNGSPGAAVNEAAGTTGAEKPPVQPAREPAGTQPIQPDVEVKAKQASVPPAVESKDASQPPASRDLFQEVEAAITPSYTGNLEAVFAKVLGAHQEEGTTLDELLRYLAEKLQDIVDTGPECRAGDIITYAIAHNPDKFPDFLSDMLAQAVKIEDESALLANLRVATLFMKASPAQSEQTLRGFITDAMKLDQFAEVERVRRIITYFMSTDRSFTRVLMKVMIDLLKEELERETPGMQAFDTIVYLARIFNAHALGQALIENLPDTHLSKVLGAIEAMCFSQRYNKTIASIIEAYQENEYDALKKALNVKKIPQTIQSAIVKRRYITQLSKVGSMPLDLFAEKIGLSVTDAEKMIVDSILKGDIAAKIEIVNGKPYLISEKKAEPKPDAKAREPAGEPGGTTKAPASTPEAPPGEENGDGTTATPPDGDAA